MRNLIPSRVSGEPQPASRAFKTRKGADNLAARQQAYSDRTKDGLVWDVSEVEEGGFAVFCTEPKPELKKVLGDVNIGGEEFWVHEDSKTLEHVPCGAHLFGDNTIANHVCDPEDLG